MKILFLIIFIISVISNPVSAVTEYSVAEVAKHNIESDCWVIYSDSVYDLTEYVVSHDVYMDIRDWCGTDMTDDFETKAGQDRDHKNSSYSQLEIYNIGKLIQTDNPTSEVIPADESVTITQEHSDDDEEYSVEISGEELKALTVNEVAELWEIDSNDFLSALINEFDLTGSYSINSLIDEIKDEADFSPKDVKDVAQDIKDNGFKERIEENDVDSKKKNPYNLVIPLGGTAILYWVLFYLTKNKKLGSFTIHKFNMVFNTILLLSLIPSFGFGIFMMMRYQFPQWYEIDFEFMYWHVELSVVMGTIAVSHLLQRWALYWVQVKSLVKK